MLDTKEPGTHAGRLGERRLAWLAEELARGEEPVFLFLHHPPHRVGITGMDEIPRSNTSVPCARMVRWCR